MSKRLPRSWLWGLIPTAPPLVYLPALAAWKSAKQISPLVKGGLLAFGIGQLLAAAFSLDPALSLGLATIKVFLMICLVALGRTQAQGGWLSTLALGQGVLILTALAITLGQQGLNITRFTHPYYTSVSLGIAAATLTFITIRQWSALRERRGWYPTSLLALGITGVFFSGSRSAIVFLLTSLLIGIPIKNIRKGLLTLAGVLLLLGLSVAWRVSTSPEPFTILQIADRQQVWQDAWKTFQGAPIGGVGPYQSGEFLTSLYRNVCYLSETDLAQGQTCPETVEKLRRFWLTAHNGWLHSLTESGIVGTLGLLLLILAGGLRIYRSKNSILLALFGSFMVVNFVETLNLIPSLFLAEFFWILIGVADREASEETGDR